MEESAQTNTPALTNEPSLTTVNTLNETGPQPEGIVKPSKKPLKIITIALILIAVALVGVGIFLVRSNKIEKPGKVGDSGLARLEKFASEQEFKEYFSGGGSFGFGSAMMALDVSPRSFSEVGDSINLSPGAGASMMLEKASGAERFSTTNVQVMGIDEPDIVKTDGKNIFYSGGFHWGRYEVMPIEIWEDEPFLEDESVDALGLEDEATEEGPTEQTAIIMPETGRLPVTVNRSGTKIIEAFPPEELKEINSIEEQGELLLVGDKLVVFSGNKIIGYNIADKANPGKTWENELDNNNYITASRLYNGKVYTVTRSFTSSHSPCPMPYIKGQQSLTISCTDVYRPGIDISANSTITVMMLDPESGNVENRVTFAGNSGSTVVYMSENNIFVSYSYTTGLFDYFYRFMKEDGKEIFPESLVQRMEELKSYNLKEETKIMEFSNLFEEYISALGEKDREELNKQFEEKYKEYGKKHAREFQQTGIAKISLNDFTINSVGVVPGVPLNQFSLDEYQGNLRIATTTGDNWGMTGSESENDVYVLDPEMNIIGRVLGLGLGERIYSARFIEDKGYVVTFREIDPFYVLDLSDPRNPVMKGELKIPGYSSYLHPVNKDKILGVGMEDWKVKLSLFDVTNPANPTEKSKHSLDEYWSEAVNNHKAFLMDTKHSIFFLPGGNSGYIFSYSDDQLRLIKAIANIRAQRAIYLNDYLYILGRDKIIVLDQNSWDTVKTLNLVNQ
jgi:inhibitor of cysteine peptidase